jgi:uncharacterized protein
MTFEALEHRPDLVLLRCISGSKAYGTDTPQSDIDIKGVFILPEKDLFGLHYTEQVNDARNDIVFYEIKRFFQLLLKNNPNILELLATPADCVLYRHPSVERLNPSIFLSKLCLNTFAQYAFSQIKKARGLNKKIMNPMDGARKSPLAFCYVALGQKSMPLTTWLQLKGWQQTECGLVAVEHFKDLYALFHQSQAIDYEAFKGIISDESATQVSLSSVPKGIEPIAMMTFNKDAYSTYCKDYLAYHTWVRERNPTRYESNIANDKNYDAKNMMHVFRLLNTAEDIAREGIVRVRRPERDFLLRIRQAAFEYDDLVKMAEEKMALIQDLFETSPLPDRPDETLAEQLLIEVRETFYFKM